MSQLTDVNAGKLPPGIRCPYCKGSLSDVRSNGERWWVHCYSCHLEFTIEPSRNPRPFRTPEDLMPEMERRNMK